MTIENPYDVLERALRRERSERLKLQQRIDKAIEYIEYNDETLYTYEPDYDYEENIVSNYDVSNFREDLLEILKGEPNNE